MTDLIQNAQEHMIYRTLRYAQTVRELMLPKH